MQESIIVYRNPLEKMFWESFDGIFLIYILSGMVGAFLGIYAGNILIEKFNKIKKIYHSIIMLLTTIIGTYLTISLIQFAINW